MLPPKQYKFDEKSMAYTGMVSPFWLLFNSKPSNELGNMVLSFTTYKNLKIQAIYNRCEVFTHDQLCMMEPEEEETISKEAGKEEKKRKASTASESKAAKKTRWNLEELVVAISCGNLILSLQISIKKNYKYIYMW